jgi:hypothetical protein
LARSFAYWSLNDGLLTKKHQIRLAVGLTPVKILARLVSAQLHAWEQKVFP